MIFYGTGTVPSVVEPDPYHPYPDSIQIQWGPKNPDPQYGSGGGQKLARKETVQKFHLLKCWMLSFEG
jgi:hypothetical protein